MPVRIATRVTGDELLNQPITVANPSPIRWRRWSPRSPRRPSRLPAGGNGFTIERTYYTLDGSEANVTEATQNERYVVVLKVNQLNDWASRVLVNDLLPAGFEIDNPRLVNSADLTNFPWLAQTEAAHLEFRDDRFVAAFNRDQGDDSVVHAGLCRARRDARHLRPSGGERRGHVPAGILGPHRFRRDGGQGALT